MSKGQKKLTNSPRQKLLAIGENLKYKFYEREEVIDGILVALLSQQHLFMLGKPGTAKSQLITALCDFIQFDKSQYFNWLLTKFTTPEEVVGSVTLQSLEQGNFIRKTEGKLPSAYIAFLDEIFKANSAILNSLLTAINERKFHNDGMVVDIPLMSIFSASNELPQSDELNAMYDRLLLRYVVDKIKESKNFVSMLKGRFQTPAKVIEKINIDELKQMQKEVAEVRISDDILDTIDCIRIKLEDNKIFRSDRTFEKSIGILQAVAYLNGRDEVEEQDLTIYEHILWDTPDQREQIKNIVFDTVKASVTMAIQLEDMAIDIYNGFVTEIRITEEEKKLNVVTDIIDKLKKISSDLEEIKIMSSHDRVIKAYEKVNQLKHEVFEKHYVAHTRSMML